LAYTRWCNLVISIQYSVYNSHNHKCPQWVYAYMRRIRSNVLPTVVDFCVIDVVAKACNQCIVSVSFQATDIWLPRALDSSFFKFILYWHYNKLIMSISNFMYSKQVVLCALLGSNTKRFLRTGCGPPGVLFYKRIFFSFLFF